uniref:endosome-associated-trafficking regulator 1 n=1 Tax=Doryrhamphus excisus TaxID=161450 RepID=UPI0025ADCFBF|nr:endosome-associated-trafficking regulator 1 [Doryrhamphus excisus]
MSTHGTREKTLLTTEDEEELNPFSFREFLRSKKHDPEADPDPDQQQPAWKVEKMEGGWSLQSGGDGSSHSAEDEEEESSILFSKRGGGANYEGDDEMSMLQPNTSSRERVEQLQQENRWLRRTITDLQRRSEANEHRVEALEAELRQRRCQEQQEVRDMENMVLSVERNLELMTTRALRAEGGASKMRAELRLLQAEVDRLRSENASLTSGQSDIVMAMRHNAHVASDYLDKTASHAHSSIRRLLEGAESLHLVSQLLRSIDSVSEVTSES